MREMSQQAAAGRGAGRGDGRKPRDIFPANEGGEEAPEPQRRLTSRLS
jgi:hypothetical protein